MKNIVIPGAVWVIVLALVNELARVLQVTYPGAEWLPVAVGLLLIAAKAIQTYAKPSVEAVAPEPFVMPASAPAPAVAERKAIKFLVG